MTRLRTDPNLDDSDGFYEELLALHEGRSKAESDALNARLVLLLANHIGDRLVLREAFQAAASPTGRDGALAANAGAAPGHAAFQASAAPTGRDGARREFPGTSAVSRTEPADGAAGSDARRDA